MTISNNSSSCPCKYFVPSLSSATAAEYGNMEALSRRIKIMMSSSSSSSSLLINQRHLRPKTKDSCHDDDHDINNDGGITPLHLAAQHGHALAVSLLLQTGHVDVDTGLRSTKTEMKNKDDDTLRLVDNHNYWTTTTASKTGKNQPCNVTPLHRASFSGALAAMQTLMDHGADLLAKDTSYGDERTPLHKAVAGGRPYAVNLLLMALKQCDDDNRKRILWTENNNDNNNDDDDDSQEGEEDDTTITIGKVATTKNTTKEQGLSSWIQVALRTKDAYGKTPIDLAKYYCTQLTPIQQEKERRSVRRWDEVAGGEKADWDACLNLLLLVQEEEEVLSIRSSNSKGGIYNRDDHDNHAVQFLWKQQQYYSKNNAESTSSLSLCQEEERCCWKTYQNSLSKKWESEFQKAFPDTASLLVSSSVNNASVVGCNEAFLSNGNVRTDSSDDYDDNFTNYMQEKDGNNMNSALSDPSNNGDNDVLRDTISNNNSSNDGSISSLAPHNDPTTNIENHNTAAATTNTPMKMMMMGRQCDICGVHTMTVFRSLIHSKNNLLVCQRCRRTKP